MTKKKVAIGCLATIGGIVIILVAISIIASIISTPDAEETPATTQTPVETERPQLPIRTTPSITGGEELKEGEEPEEEEGPLIPVEVELIKAQSEGDIEVAASSAGSLVSFKLFIISQSDDLLDVAILPGTIFESQAASIQSMVVTTKRMLSVEPHGRVGPISIDAVSINMQLDVADESDSLIVGMTPATGNIMKLLNLDHFQDESSRVRQFAIWTITDNPGRSEYVGIGPFGMGTGPNTEEIAKIKVLFEKAGISIAKYKAL